jgi:hypothetical protein
MKRHESPEAVRRWFFNQLEVLWPIAGGSLSLRKSPCIRARCSACETGEQHASYVLYGRQAGRRFALYVPDELADPLERAIANGRAVQALVTEAGQRYLRALKAQRRS